MARHHLAGDGPGPEGVVRSLVALHATDPATVFLSVLARSATTSVAEVTLALQDRHTLVRWMAMRRTLFVLPRDDVPMVHAAIGTDLARTLRTQLINRLRRNGTTPPIAGQVEPWLETVGDETVDALRRRGSATGRQLSADERRLRTTILAHATSDRPQSLTTSLLTVLAADGRIVRGAPTGVWTSRQTRWEPTRRWWPDGLPAVNPDEARRDLARRWLERFGPATVEDLQWWTGWSKTTTRRAVTDLAPEEVDLHGRPGMSLLDTQGGDRFVDDAASPASSAPPVAALLPALDCTPMGWRHRDWFLGIDPRLVFDTAGNIGPTVWWDGRVVGSWAVTAPREIRTELVGDVGADAEREVRTVADALARRLEGAVVTPAARTPLERAITAEHRPLG